MNRDWEAEDAASEQVIAWFDKYQETDYKRVHDRLLTGFNILRGICDRTGHKGTIIAGADHDIIYLDHGSWTVYTEEDVKTLLEHGIFYHEDGLACFV